MEQIAGQLIASVATILVAALVLTGTVYQSRAQRRQASNAQKTADISARIDSWDRLADQHLKEIDRLEGRVTELEAKVDEEHAITQAFSKRCETLEQENRRLKARKAGGPR